MRPAVHLNRRYQLYYSVVDDFGNILYVFVEPRDIFLRAYWELSAAYVGGLGV